MRFFEQPKRSLVKSISHRILMVASDTVIIYLLTHKIVTTLSLVILTNLSATLIYYLHERVWNHIHWGRSQKR